MTKWWYDYGKSREHHSTWSPGQPDFDVIRIL